MADSAVQVDRQDGVTLITLDDPKTRNALSPEMAQELYALLSSKVGKEIATSFNYTLPGLG